MHAHDANCASECELLIRLIARNIILFTLTMRDDFGSEENLASSFNIFFHLFLDASSLEYLLSQCRHLAESSESLEKWHGSSFSKYIKIGTSLTLQELHRHWRCAPGAADPDLGRPWPASVSREARTPQLWRRTMQDTGQDEPNTHSHVTKHGS